MFSFWGATGLPTPNRWIAMDVAETALRGNMLTLSPVWTYQASHEKQGEKLTAFLATAQTVLISGAASSAITAAVLSAAPFLPGWLPFLAASVLLAEPSERFYEATHRGLRFIQQVDQRMHRIQTGGEYEDTVNNRAKRYSAIRDMASSRQASRVYLGREAMYFHQ